LQPMIRKFLFLAMNILLMVTAPVLAEEDVIEQGIAAFESELYERAFELLKSLSEAGDPDAQFYVGRMYSFGLGVDQQFERGLRTTFAAAQSGQPQAQRTMGYSYYKGIGVREDREEAVKWYGRAAEAGDPAAQRSMGLQQGWRWCGARLQNSGAVVSAFRGTGGCAGRTGTGRTVFPRL